MNRGLARRAVGRGPGLNQPIHRDRASLDQPGRSMTGNPNVIVSEVELLATSWQVLRRTTYDYRHIVGLDDRTARDLRPGQRRHDPVLRRTKGARDGSECLVRCGAVCSRRNW